jgi:hypothetical protein
MNKTNSQLLKALELESMKLKYPNTNESYLGLTKWNDNSANALTQCVIAYITYMGGQAERISSQGQYREGAKIQVGTGELAHQRQLPGKWTPGQSTKGTADISSTIRGRSVKIEIKYGKDVQSQVQKEYQASIERAGGVYIIVRTFDEFVVWYNQFTEGI